MDDEEDIFIQQDFLHGGLTLGAVRRFFDPPDEYRLNPNCITRPIKVYYGPRVRRIVRSEEYQVWKSQLEMKRLRRMERERARTKEVVDKEVNDPEEK